MDAPIQFTCQHCSHHMQLPSSTVGRQGKCPGCGEVVTITAPVRETPSDGALDVATGPLFIGPQDTEADTLGLGSVIPTPDHQNERKIVTKKQHGALNTGSLWGEQCPHCGMQVPRGGYETCHACNKEFVWVRSGIPPIGQTIFEGPCLPGQEEEALAYLRQKALEQNELTPGLSPFPNDQLMGDPLQPTHSYPQNTRVESQGENTNRDGLKWSGGPRPLEEHWPFGSLVLTCHNCNQQSMVAQDCESCGQEATRNGSPWSFNSAHDGGHGYFCIRCENGYTSASCQHCGQHNAVTLSSFRVKKTKLETTVNAIWFGVLLILAIAFIVLVVSTN